MSLPWIECTGRPAASAGLMVWAPMRSPQWMTAKAPSAFASRTAFPSGSARSWLSETMQIFMPGIIRIYACRTMALIPPHGGGALKALRVDKTRHAQELARAANLPRITVSSREKGDLIMLGMGGFTPLPGFMTHADWKGVCDSMRTADGTFWPIPITLSTDKATAEGLALQKDVALVDPDDGSVLATMTVTEKYAIDKAHECKSVFRTDDAAHPGVQMVMAQGDVNLAGPVRVLSDGGFKAKYGALFMTPAETRAEFERLG